MIKVNGVLIEQDKFGDGTLKCKEPELGKNPYSTKTILWCYDNDAELFTIISLVEFFRNQCPGAAIELKLPYIPHARQDRRVSGRLFTLRAFAKVINALEFCSVRVLDPHSDVSCALFDRLDCSYSVFDTEYGDAAVLYPDAGAAKKYSSIEGVPNPIIGNKHRNEEGRIDGYELVNFVEGTKKVAIRDDICSYGGTFVAAAKELRKRGVEEIVLFVSHCENNILKGEVFDYIDRVFTTDSIFTESHPQITIVKSFRGE